MAYEIEGRLLEVCTCNVLCPCWVGEDPDPGTCDSIEAYRVDAGRINGIDVSGLTVAVASHIPGNIMEGNWDVLLYVDDAASDEQFRALGDLFAGRLGGPLEEYARSYGRLVDIRRAPITFEVVDGKGTFRVGDVAEAELAPYLGPDGAPTKLIDTPFSTIPGSPAFAAKASYYRRRIPELSADVAVEGHNAIQGNYVFEHA